jgi:hypothetical protein
MTVGSDLMRLAREVDLEAVKAYLSAHDWKIDVSAQGKLLRMEAPAGVGGEGVFAMVPSSPDLEDYPIRVSELAMLVGSIENRPGEDVLRDMAASASAGPLPAVPESPFHLRGYIGPQHAGAWRAMKWHDDIIQSALRDFEHNPPEYVLVRAPALSGKTTFAMQFMARLARVRPDFLTVYLPLGGANASLATFLQGVRDAVASRLREWLASAAMPPQELLELRSVIDSWAALCPDNLSDLLRTLLWHVPENFRRVIVVVDDADLLPAGQRDLVAEDLRSLHAARSIGPLGKFSVLVLARSLQRYPHVVSPLANVVVEYRLNDFSLEDAQAFLDRCGSILGRLRFNPDAVRYVYHKAGGQAIATQRVCAAAARKKTPGGAVEMADIHAGVCECFEQGGGFVDRVLDLEELTVGARTVLDQMLREGSVPPLAFDPAVAQLMDLGLAKVGGHNRCVCRSPLVHELLVKRYFIPQVSPSLTSSEARLLALPQVLPLLCNSDLFDRVREAVKSNAWDIETGEAEREVTRILLEKAPDLDAEEIRYWLRRYYDDIATAEVDREKIMQVVAKVFVNWSLSEVLEEYEKSERLDKYLRET